VLISSHPRANASSSLSPPSAPPSQDGECSVATGPPVADCPIYTNLQELKLGVCAPPSPTGPPAQLLDLWERHVDPGSARSYYYNTVTKETTWKPPRRARDHAISRVSPPATLPHPPPLLCGGGGGAGVGFVLIAGVLRVSIGRGIWVYR